MRPSRGGLSAVPEDRLVSKPNVKAMVWWCFGIEAESGVVKDQDLPVFRVYHVCVKTKNANTSNLYSHLKKHHLIESSTAREYTIEEFFKLATKLSSDSHEHRELTKAVTYYLAKDTHHAYSFELSGFRIVSKLNPRYVLPGRNYFSHTGIPSLYNEVRQRVSGRGCC